MEEILDCFLGLAPKIQALITNGETSYASSTNTSGDLQLRLDLQSDALIEKELSKIPSVRSLFSEEKENSQACFAEAEYCVAYDPIDGSSLIDSNASVGTIFAIYLKSFRAQNLVASGYILYGPRLEIVIARKNETGLFHARFDPQSKSWENQERLFLQSHGKINAPGGKQKDWSIQHKAMIDAFFAEGYQLRYAGGMVPDLHQILIKKGGLFSYPATTNHPQGKLRKLFEVFPFALIFECAGGSAIDGKNRLLDLPIASYHESCGCFFGSQKEIRKVQETYANFKNSN